MNSPQKVLLSMGITCPLPIRFSNVVSMCVIDGLVSLLTCGCMKLRTQESDVNFSEAGFA